ncbi:MAG: hypothetical protein M9949_13745 [Candidatus Kapabacteria bacterium]|nr:hypothetical protein [Candidatus Kapabacteria bacterium]
MKTKLETINELEKELPFIKDLYKDNCVNWTGKTKDTDEFYTEIIANELLRNLKEFDKIPTVTRTESYYRENHCNIEIDICESNRNEEIFAKRITGLKLEGLGLIKDYQIPLKDTLQNSGLGKIDLISFNDNTKTLYLIELKYEANKETLLKASLESFTYFKVVDKTKLINDYFNNQKFILNKVFNPVDPDTIKVKPAVLVVPGCKAYDELEEVEIGDRPKMKALALALDISYFTFEFYPREIRL